MSALLLPPAPEDPRAGPALPWPHAALAAALALLLVVFQVGFVLVCTTMPTWDDAYRQLHQWDTAWFESIARLGYHKPAAMTRESFGNVAFLPAYPWTARLVHNLTGLGWRYAMPLAGQVASVGFWFYLLLLLRQSRLPGTWMVLAVVGLLAHPAAFFLVLGYAEPLFLASMLGFLFWSQRTSRLAFVLACAHGMVMCATRLVGVAVVVYPLVHLWCTDPAVREQVRLIRPGRRLMRPVALALGASLGLILFFAYCWWEFGAWNLYFQTEKFAWGVRPNYFALLNVHTYLPPKLLATLVRPDPDNLSRLSVPLLMLLLVGLGCVEWRRARRGGEGWRSRLGFYVIAWLMFYINVCGRDSLAQVGMIRYGYAILVLVLIPTLAPLYRAGWVQAVPRWRRVACVSLLLAYGLACQMVYIYRFSNGEWVA